MGGSESSLQKLKQKSSLSHEAFFLFFSWIPQSFAAKNLFYCIYFSFFYSVFYNYIYPLPQLLP